MKLRVWEIHEIFTPWKLSTVRYSQAYVTYRLLDVQCSDGRYEHELIVYMVFEYMDQDLDQFIHQSRLDNKLTKVSVHPIQLSQKCKTPRPERKTSNI